MNPQVRGRGVIFPADVFNSRSIDEEFRSEADVVWSLGGEVILIDHTELVAGSLVTKTHFSGEAYYRGWMMEEESYSLMDTKMSDRGIHLLTSTEEYAKGYYFHGWYENFKHLTPRSYWFAPTQTEYLEEVEKHCGVGPYFVKDSVKSRKHEWDTACYAPTLEVLPEIVGNLLGLQTGQKPPFIVVREFEKFRKDQGEVRVWWVQGRPVVSTPHPDTPSSLPAVETEFMAEVTKAVKELECPFVTTDLAQLVDGRWRVIEVSDGQVSGLPRGFDFTPLMFALLNS